MRIRKLFLMATFAGSLIAALIAVAAPGASANTPSGQSAVSANWSGYVASTNNGNGFSSVSGSWVQPSASCSAGQGASSFWVGLGGSGQQSQALEQTGTEADCNGSGSSTNYAWYELVPSAPVKLDLTISPGDHITGKVEVSGSSVTVYLADTTTGQSVTKTLQMNNPDVSSAEWIAEAPSSCDQMGNCTPVTLADFGKVDFSNAYATAGGHTGTISDSDWTTEPVSLNADAGGYGAGQFVSSQSSGGAQPSGLSSDGSAFSVSYAGSDSASASATSGAGGTSPYGAGTSPYGAGGGYGGYGYGGGYGGYGGYGYGGYGGYGYGGYGGYGYAGYGYGGYVIAY